MRAFREWILKSFNTLTCLLRSRWAGKEQPPAAVGSAVHQQQRLVVRVSSPQEELARRPRARAGHCSRRSAVLLL